MFLFDFFHYYNVTHKRIRLDHVVVIITYILLILIYYYQTNICGRTYFSVFVGSYSNIINYNYYIFN